MATTATASEPVQATEVEPNFPPHRMTVDRYVKLVDSGVYNGEDQVFLWHGRLVEEMGKGRPHGRAENSLFLLLHRLLPEGWHVELEQPMVLGDDSMPEPDLMVVRGAFDDYPVQAPTSDDVSILVEVADSSLAHDSGTKLLTYAWAAIPVYWIVNIPRERVEVYSEPTGPVENPSYQVRRDFGRDEEIPVVIAGREVGRVAVRDILP